jgi:hypothetical protein
MNKFQKKEARDIHRMIAYYPIRYQMDAKYKIVRRNFRKMARLLTKRNQKAHKEALSKAINDYVRQDLFNTIYITKPIEVKNE